MAYIENMVDRAIALLASQFRGTDALGNLTNFQKLIKSVVLSMQDLENVNNQLNTQRNIFDAVGVQLDGIGEILGLPRNDGESDDDYRERLQFQIFINAGTGTPEEVMVILAFLTQGTEIGYIEYYPAAYQMSTNGTQFPTPPEELVTAIQSASPAAVQYVPITATYNVDVPFVFGLDSETELLWITDPADPSELENLELDTTDLLYVNPALNFTSNQGGGFAEYGSPDIDTTGAGQLAEVIMFNGSQAPPA